MACCINLGYFDSCEPISTGISATQTGVYKYVLHTPIARIKGTLDVAQGEILTIDCNLNENSYFKLEITAPNGMKLDCMEFYTRYTTTCHES
jgi:hypothetical protein